jgi:hypothetical protein
MRTIILLFLTITACTATPAERATYDAIAPAHAAYVQSDPILSPEQVARRLDMLNAWGVRVGAIKPAGASAGGGK